jgi:uncharacterized protein (TIGR02646 family)
VRTIVKTEEPAEFSRWREGSEAWQPTAWDDLQNPLKQDLWMALLREQGHVCCYCGARIRHRSYPQGAEASHIEHLLPREHYPKRMFDYDNVVASCQGRQKDSPPREPRHCGSHKDNWPKPAEEALFISPLDAACARHFRYRADGHVAPAIDSAKSAAAAETIRRLRLDHPRLIAQRAVAIETVLEELAELPTEEERQVRRSYYLGQRPGPQNDYEIEPFLAAIEDFLRWY